MQKKPFFQKSDKRFVKPKQASKPRSIVNDGMVRLNKRIADAGICSRREADKLIEAGTIKVNGKIVTSLGTRVSEADIIEFGDEQLKTERKVYILLNKPKDYKTTVDDPYGKRTVLQLIAKACKERVVPIGKLDTAFTGLLLFTNDSELIKRLSHPRFNIEQLFHLTLDKVLPVEDLYKLREGRILDGDTVIPEEVEYVGEGSDRKQIGLRIHIGKVTLLKKLFQDLGYEIIKLDKVAIAGLSKRDLPRGKWRFLTKEELAFLKMALIK